MTKTVELSPNGIKKLIKDLNNLKKDLIKASDIIQEDLLNQAETVIKNQVESSFADGNIDVHVEVEKNKVSLVGSQVVYFEYGTGYTGKTHETSPHMSQINYAHSNRKQWNYRSRITGQWTPSKGLSANMPVFKASLNLKRNKIEIVKKRIREVINKNDFN